MYIELSNVWSLTIGQPRNSRDLFSRTRLTGLVEFLCFIDFFFSVSYKCLYVSR